MQSAEVAELVDAADLKSAEPLGPCGFESRPRHQRYRGSLAASTLDCYTNVRFVYDQRCY